jgi:hypothetical protein
MNENLEFAIRTGLIGIGASAAMDLWAIFLKRFFGILSLDNKLLGRWLGHLPSGRFMHESMAQASPIRGELVIGWCAHYLIGITFAALLLSIWGLRWARSPSLSPALFIGIVTIVAPFFILPPGMGAGIAASKTPKPNIARLKSLGAHSAYALGLYGVALLTAMLIPAGKPEIKIEWGNPGPTASAPHFSKGGNRMNAEVYHVTFRTRATQLEGQPGRLRVRGNAIRAWRKTAESGDDMTTVDPAGITYDTDVTFTSHRGQAWGPYHWLCHSGRLLWSCCR